MVYGLGSMVYNAIWSVAVQGRLWSTIVHALQFSNYVLRTLHFLLHPMCYAPRATYCVPCTIMCTAYCVLCTVVQVFIVYHEPRSLYQTIGEQLCQGG